MGYLWLIGGKTVVGMAVKINIEIGIITAQCLAGGKWRPVAHFQITQSIAEPSALNTGHCTRLSFR
ncbi:MAG: hypothetical protein WBC93_04775 [Sulfitobacter sp.]